MNWAMNDIQAEIDYRRYGTVDKSARKHLDLLRGRPGRWRPSRTRGGRRVG